MQHLERRRSVGSIFPAFHLETLAHGSIRVPGPGLTHLQFRRFAGCPVCSVQVRRFALSHEELRAAQIRTVSLFHSPKEAMLPYQHELVHPVVADPARRLFNLFGVERSPFAMANPRAWATAIGGMLSGPTNPFERAPHDGLPADFLIASTGGPEEEANCQIVALHYGTSSDDQWSVDEVLEKARIHRESAASIKAESET